MCIRLKRVFCTVMFFASCVSGAYCAKDGTDTLSEASTIDGGDIILYNLYSQNKAGEEGPVYAEMFLDRADTTSTDIRIAEVWDYMGSYYESVLYKTSEAINALERARKIYSLNKDRHMVAVEELKLAALYLKKDLYHKTLDYVMKARDIFIEEHDTPRLLDCYNMLGIVHYVCKEYDEAKAYFDKFAAGAREVNDTSRMIAAMNNAARLANTMHDSVMTNKLVQESIDLCSRQNDSLKLGKIYLNVFEAYVGFGNMDKAYECLSLAKPLIRSDGDMGEYYMKLGMLNSAEGKAEDAIARLNMALDYLDKGEFDKEKQYCLNILHKLYAEKGDWKNAYAALENYYRIDNDKESEDMLLELFRYQSELKVREDKEKVKESQNRQILVFMTGVSLLLVIAVYIIMAMKKNRLETQHRESELAAQEKILEMKKLQQYYIDKITEETADKLIRLKSEIKEPALKNKVNWICKDLVQSRVDDDRWKEISKFIPEYNSGFYQNLIREFPNLTINERRLCTLLNKNMTTKEISEITKQSLQSINTARGRLRSKLGLTDSKITLQEFLSKFN